MTEQEYRSQKVNELYFRILKEANSFLAAAKAFTVEELKTQTDPTIEQQVKNLQLIVMLMEQLLDDDSYDDVRMAINAKQFTGLLSYFAKAVVKKDEGKLKEIADELEKHLCTV